MKVEEFVKAQKELEKLALRYSVILDQQKHIEKMKSILLPSSKDTMELTIVGGGYVRTGILIPIRVVSKILKVLADDTKKAIEEVEKEIGDVRICGIEVKEVENE